MGSWSACFIPSLLLLTTLFTLVLDARKQGGLLRYLTSGLVPWWSYLLIAISLISLATSCVSCACPDILTGKRKWSSLLFEDKEYPMERGGQPDKPARLRFWICQTQPKLHMNAETAMANMLEDLITSSWLRYWEAFPIAMVKDIS